MKRCGIGAKAFVPLLLALTACGGGQDGTVDGRDGPAQVSTFVYVTAHCREGKPGSFSGSEALWVRQGDRVPVKVYEASSIGQPPYDGLCRLWGESGLGGNQVFVSAIQRWGISPDSSLVLFELTDDFSIFTHVMPDEQKGIYAVRADGSGLRKIAPASRDSMFRIDWPCKLDPQCPHVSSTIFAGFSFSADGRRVVYTDVGMSETGEMAPEIFTLAVSGGEPRQITDLPPLPLCDDPSQTAPNCVQPWVLPISPWGFLNERTIAFNVGGGRLVAGGGIFTERLNADGGPDGAPQAVPLVPLPGGTLVPVFEITGEPSALFGEFPPANGGDVIREVFLVEPRGDPSGEPRVLQLTNYRRSDTFAPSMSLDRQRVFFISSADPLGTNPQQLRQWFSVDRLGGGLRQVTALERLGGRDCTILNGDVDAVTGVSWFQANCDPLGTNPMGLQVPFAVRPDGTGLRQLLQTRGLITEPDGTVDVDLYAGGTVNAVGGAVNAAH